ncbi:RagB/SusD family nutrient uptake outer membrane protein [Saccharicrinis aurantiacus]|uniref:RagB/SusD family nutrient uptake outer membrane protein n=1 Tax=Saccharicrinis aurantiacus TaxID=1849719 RepID=UPI0024928D9A|nr:RagB/SusD family nutrient uptake outer membrane protein [Saccharicrinis aurantiacus]
MIYIKNKLLFAVFFLTITLGGCSDFLDRVPKDSPSPDNFFVDETSARMAVNACYHPWVWGGWAMVKRDMHILLDAMTDDSYWRPNRGASIALEKWNITPTHANVRDWWKYPYECINAANFAIENIPLSSDINFTEEQQIPYIAEARFFRAYSYLFLTTFYGDVPLLTSVADNIDAYNTPRSSKADVLEQVIIDFKYAMDNLPAIQKDQGPPNSAAAATLLAKTYLFTENWAKAEEVAEQAISIAEGAGHGLEDQYLDIWDNEDNKEVLFAWTFVPNIEEFSQNVTIQRLCRDLPAPLKVGIGGDGWGYALPQRDLFDSYETGDPRREFTIYSPEMPYEIYNGAEDFTYTHKKVVAVGDTVSWEVTYKPGDMVEYDYRWSPTGLNVKKMVQPVNELSNVRWDGMDIPVVRMAELYLILAEALAEQENNEALTWVNKVRSRASVAMPDKTLADGDLVELVRHERRVELAMEGLRIYDLIRWGNIKTVFGDGTKVKRHFYADFMDESTSSKYDSPIGDLTLDPLFPLPQQELDYNTQINQNNPGW